MRPHVIQEPQSRNDPVVQIDEFCLGQLVDVDLHACPMEERPRVPRPLAGPRLQKLRRGPGSPVLRQPFLDAVGKTNLHAIRRENGTRDPDVIVTLDSGSHINAAYQRRGAAASAACACSPGGSTPDGRETKHTGQSRCRFQVAPPQRFTDVVELAGIVE